MPPYPESQQGAGRRWEDQVFYEESASDLTVTVQGEQYHAEATVDINADGVDDTAIVQTDRGTISFTDTDADGHADLMTELDANGDLVGQARFDPATGEWVQVDNPQDPRGGSVEGAVSRADESLTADLPGHRDADLGTPTHDTDGDGIGDSVVTTDADGDTVIFTDSDADGDADFATEITKRGQVKVSEHTGDGDWTVVERGHLDEQGEYHVDPRTGEWVRG